MSWADEVGRVDDTVFETFNETVVYAPPDPPGGDPVELQGIFRQRPFAVSIGESGYPIESIETSVRVRVTELEAHGLEDLDGAGAFLIRGIQYVIHNVQGPGDDGIVKAVLQLAEHA